MRPNAFCVRAITAVAIFAGVAAGVASVTTEASAQSTQRWGGAYIGAQIGGAWGNTTAQSGPLAGFDQTYNYDSRGVVGGAFIGVNVVTSGLVWGAEADIEGSSLSKNGVGSLGFLHRTDMDWLGSLRGRIGFSSGPALFYATAGLAFGDVKITKATTPAAVPFASYSDVRTGWTVGAGVDYAFSQNLFGRLEYRYTDLGRDNFSSVAVNSIDTSRFDFHTVRAGIAYKF